MFAKEALAQRQRLRHSVMLRVIMVAALAALLLLPSQAEAQQFHRSRVEYLHAKDRDWSYTISMVQRRHQPGELIFAEEFYTFDSNVWEHEIAAPGRTNGEFQSYGNDPANSYVRNGILYIKPTISVSRFGERGFNDGNGDFGTGCSDTTGKQCKQQRSIQSGSGHSVGQIASARINTRSAFGFQFGQLEVRAKLPKGNWIWPAIWLMPQGNKFGMWPQSGEIDIMESRGNKELFTAAKEDIGCNQFGSTLHFGMNRTTDMWRLAHFKRTDPEGFESKFHNYGVIWTPEEMIFTLDEEVLGTVAPPEGGFWQMGNFTGSRMWDDHKMSPFNQPFYIILNVAVGGTSGYFPENSTPRKPWKNSSPQAREEFWNSRNEWLPTWDDENSALQIDYIRIWAL